MMIGDYMSRYGRRVETPRDVVGAFLVESLEVKRHGYVFKPRAQREDNNSLEEQQVVRVVSQTGEKAGVVVAPRRGTALTEDRPTLDGYRPANDASAHDLCRSFGE